MTELKLRACGITDLSILGSDTWECLDLSDNMGLSGTITASGLILENCGLDDTFDFFGNEKLESLYMLMKLAMT